MPPVAAPDVVVVGSYPPIPGPGTAATLAAVRRAWAQGATVAMVGYRAGAAPLTVPVSGLLAGRRLGQVRAHFGGPSQVFLGVQRAVPFSDRRRWAMWATAAGLAGALRKFERATVVVGEDPDVPLLCLRLLALGADGFSVPDDDLAQRLVRRHRVPARLVHVENVVPFPALPQGPGTAAMLVGLYDPAAAGSFQYVEMPPMAVRQRARARARARLERLPLGPARRLLRRL